MNDIEVSSFFKNEASVLIYSWIRDEFPQLKLGVGNDIALALNAFSVPNPGETELMTASIDKASLIIYVRNLDVSIYVSTPRSRSRIRELSLLNPTSISSLQEVIRHIIKVTLSPWGWPE